MLRSVVDDEYLPEFSTLVVRDDHVDHGYDVPDALTEHAVQTDPAGSIAVAGAGWLKAAAAGDYQEVQLEAHDSAPPDDSDGWSDLVETPYLSVAGSVGLSYVTSGTPSGARLQLGIPGTYRVRVGRRPHPESGHNWRIQFWPDPDVRSPRWLVRSRSAVATAPDGWSSVLPFVVTELPMLVNAAANGNPEGATLAELEAWCAAHGRPFGWLEEPLWPEPPRPAPTGHADLDAAEEERRRTAIAHRAEERQRLDAVAAQLGLPSPSDRRDLLKLLTTIGLLDFDENSQRFRTGERPRRALDVLDLPADRARALGRSELVQRYRSAVADLVAVVRWSPDQHLRIGRGDLAELLAMSPGDLDGTVRFALAEGHLITDDSSPGPEDAGFVGLAIPVQRSEQQPVLPAPPDAPPPTPDPLPASRVATARLLVHPSAQPGDRVEEPVTEDGPPPRAGITDGGGGLVVWRDGVPVVLARPRPKQPYRAVETAYGVVLFYPGDEALLVRPDGETVTLGSPNLEPWPKLSEDGRFLAVAEAHYGRRPRFGLHLIDLADGTSRILPWDENCQVTPSGVHSGVVYLNGEPPEDDRARLGHSVGWRWLPEAAAPEPIAAWLGAVDPLSGTMLTADGNGRLVLLATGDRYRIDLDSSARLAPGGDRLYTFRSDPFAVTLFGVTTGASDPHIVSLPPGCRFGPPNPPVWEDPDHLLVSTRDNFRQPGAVRVELTSGRLQLLQGVTGFEWRFVEPWLGAVKQG